MSSKLGMHALLINEQGHETLIRMGAEIDQKWLPFIQKHVQKTQDEAKKQQDILKAIQIDAAGAKAASIMELIRLTTATIIQDQKQYQAQLRRCVDISLEGMELMVESSKQIMDKIAQRVIHQASVEANRMYQAMTHLEPGRITSYPDIPHSHITNGSTTVHDIIELNQEYIEYDRIFLEKTATEMLHNAVPDYDAVAQQYNQTCEELERLRNTNALYEEKLERIRKQQDAYTVDMKHSEQNQERDESQHKQACMNLQAETDSLIRAASHAQSECRSMEETSNETLKSISWESSKVLEELESIVKTAERMVTRHT
ncbi:hypothetical protein M9435_003262 [Picochlorum sp. BPE23]|nr:hypothetical protein M9435_003262 [Picochlorum sp. BPE23]